MNKVIDIFTLELLTKLHVEQKLSTVEIGKRFGVSSNTVASYLKNFNIPRLPRGFFNRSKIYRNKEFFKKPNVLNSFIAGFIAADGCVQKRIDKGGISYMLQIILHEQDQDYLENIRLYLGYDGKVVKQNKNQCRLTINGANSYYQDLLTNFSITPNKTLSLKPPVQLSYENQLSYLIGLIDGDGHIGYTRSNSIIISVTGTESICRWIKEIWDQICKENGVEKECIIYKYKNKRAWSVSACGPRAKCIVNRLKLISVPKMERKWGKFK